MGWLLHEGSLVISWESKQEHKHSSLVYVMSVFLIKGSLCAPYIVLIKSSFIVVTLAILPFPDAHPILLKNKTKSLN